MLPTHGVSESRGEIGAEDKATLQHFKNPLGAKSKILLLALLARSRSAHMLRPGPGHINSVFHIISNYCCWEVVKNVLLSLLAFHYTLILTNHKTNHCYMHM